MRKLLTAFKCYIFHEKLIKLFEMAIFNKILPENFKNHNCLTHFMSLVSFYIPYTPQGVKTSFMG